MTRLLADDAEVSAAPVPLLAAVCVNSAPGIKSEGLCEVLWIGIRIIVPDPGPADPDPFQLKNVELETIPTFCTEQNILCSFATFQKIF